MDNPLIQRAYVAYANIKCSLIPYLGPVFKTRDFAAIDWDHSIEIEKQPGTGVMHVGRAVGKYDANASITMYLDAATAFQESLLLVNKTLIESPFDISVSWEPLNGKGRIWTAMIIGAIICNESSKNAPGPGGAAIEMPLSVDRVFKISPTGKEIRLV